MNDPLWPVSMKGVVLIGSKVALVRNDRDEWELPGGRLEPGETPEECVAREVHEELGITVAVEQLIDAWVEPVEPTKSVLVVTFGCTLQGPFDNYRRSIRRWANRG